MAVLIAEKNRRIDDTVAIQCAYMNEARLRLLLPMVHKCRIPHDSVSDIASRIQYSIAMETTITTTMM